MQSIMFVKVVVIFSVLNGCSHIVWTRSFDVICYSLIRNKRVSTDKRIVRYTKCDQRKMHSSWTNQRTSLQCNFNHLQFCLSMCLFIEFCWTIAHRNSKEPSNQMERKGNKKILQIFIKNIKWKQKQHNNINAKRTWITEQWLG